MYEIQMN